MRQQLLREETLGVVEALLESLDLGRDVEVSGERRELAHRFETHLHETLARIALRPAIYREV